MAKSKAKAASSNQATTDTPQIIVNQITIGQLQRGNQTLETWMNNVKAAERVVNPQRRFLLDTYLDVSIDLHYDSVMGKRIRALKNIPFGWDNITDDNVIENLQGPWFYELLHQAGLSIFEGYNVVEFLFGNDGLISETKRIPPQNVIPIKGLITKTMWGDERDAFNYREAPYNTSILEIGKPRYLGLLMKIAVYILLKRNNLGDYARFNEMFGMPLRWYEYDPNDPTARAQVTESAKAQGSAAYVVVPKGTTVNFHEANKSGQQAFSDLHKTLNDEITIGVLGQTLTTSNDGVGSNALGNVHMQVESDIAMEDRVMFELLANYSLKKNILLPRLGPVVKDAKGSFKLTEELTMEAKIKIWLSLAELGLPIAEEDFYNEFGIPFPDSRPVIVVSKPVATPPVTDPKPGGASAKKPDATLSASYSRDDVKLLYAGQCKHRHAQKALKLSYNTELNDAIESIIKKLYSNDLTPGSIDPALYELISQQLFDGVEQGFGETLSSLRPNTPDAIMLSALRDNVYVFSGFKNYQMLREASALLLDTTGQKRSFADFRTEVLKLNKEYNVTFLETEFNQATATARMASKWNGFVKQKETLPLLEYLTAGDTRVRQSHKKLNGIILPVDHPFWDTYMPPNDWNCRCNVRQLASGEQSIVKSDQLPELKDEFKFNPGKDKVIFPKSHPYYKVAAEDQQNANNNFGMKLPG